MKITLGKLMDIRNSLDKIQNHTRIKLRTSYEIANFLYQTENSANFYIENFQQIVSTYGARDENNNLLSDGYSVTIKEEHLEECEEKVMELNKIEVEIPSLSIYLYDFENEYIDISILRPLLPYILKEN